MKSIDEAEAVGVHETVALAEGNTRYLYCVADSGENTDFGKIGIEGNEVYTIAYRDICAVVHNCRAEPYKSEDSDVVKNWVVTHQNVVDMAWERFGTVLPSGFDTIIKGDEVSDAEENVRRWLTEEYAELKQKIQKLKGKAEYGVQILWDARVIAEELTEMSPEIKKLDEEIKSKPRGLAYMYRQKLESALRREMEKKADECFKEFYNRILRHVDDLRVEKAKKTDNDLQMLANLSCLMDKDKSTLLGEELEQIDEMEGFSVRFTGPWPPYSFVGPG